ncbi:DUF2147 domain-containing protein [Lentibacter algarum]|uniref:DUF2147 domain-containing protein n=1 Tax=Lentibacter algarum TaxID=576131 RepID=UPI001C08D8D3|nr:DUF2147 domain-containing protein [Lentibacter algarum]MBU2983303.1 DUF2147 domain-containing protein [Lentibacter algarum]
MRHILGIAIVVALALPLAAQANSAKGLWQTEPDGKGQIGIVSVTPCGAALCGTITKAFDAQSNEVVTPNVGRQILFDLVETKTGTYEGSVLIPKYNRKVNSTIVVSGSSMKLSGCAGAVCGKQSWTRVK